MTPLGSDSSTVIFLTNGIPVAIAETKAATHLEGIDEAVIQLRRYHEETPELTPTLATRVD